MHSVLLPKKRAIELANNIKKGQSLYISANNRMKEPQLQGEFFDENISDELFLAEVISESKLKRVTCVLFEKKLSNPYLRQKIASDLSIHLQHKADYRADDIMKALEKTDKDLFIQFRDGLITLNQFKARIAERRGVVKYKVLEDIYPSLEPSIKKEIEENPNIVELIYGKNATVADLQRPLEDWESNKRCLRSIKGRAKQPPHAKSKDQHEQAKAGDTQAGVSWEKERLPSRKE